MRRRHRHDGIPTRDISSFRRAAVRAWILRVACGGAAVGLVVAAIVSSRSLDVRSPGLVPSGTTGVAVVDLSLSIEDDNYLAVRRAFQQLIAEGASIGLVVFSDIPYELLPPGTPAAELRPMLRLLVPRRDRPAAHPWSDAFRSGTRISSALQLARSMLERHGVESGSILLVSDLETAPDDVPALTRSVESLRRSEIQLRVVGLAPSRDARVIFGDVLQEGPFAPTPGAAEEPARRTTSRAPLPATLLLLAALALLALAAHERLAGRLAVPSGSGRSAEAGT